jgi:hypothetical protein
MPSYSTQASIEARISASRLLTLIDYNGDKVPDAAPLAAGIAFAGAYIAGRLKNVFGQTEIDTWTLPDDVPPLIAHISDSLCIWQFAVSKPNLFPDNELILETANEMLDKIASGAITLDNITAPVTDHYVTERVKSDFDPERDQDNQSVRTTWITPDSRELPDYPE